MDNIMIRVLEGRNLFSKDNVIYLRINEDVNKSELLKVIQTYKRIEEKLNLHSDIEVVEKNKVTEVLIRNENVQQCNLIIKSIINNSNEEFIIDEIKNSIYSDWSKKIREIARDKIVPYTKINEEEVILGYGENSLEITKGDYINKYSGDCSKLFDEVKEKEGDIHILSVTVTNGKTTTARLIYRILLALGYKSGLASTGGIYIGDKSIQHGDTTGFYSAREVLKNKKVNVAVLETVRVRRGRCCFICFKKC